MARGATPLASRTGGTRSDVVRRDLLAGLVNAVVSVPDGLASAALAGVNPVYGLYTSIAAPIGGSLLTSAQLMQISTTSASALAAGQAIASYPDAERDGALFLLVLMTGLMLAIFGLLRFGRLVRFVSHAVMTGFLIGVAAVLILDQLAPLVGFNPDGGNEVLQFIDLLLHVARFDLATIVVGLLALGLVLVLAQTPAAAFSAPVALVVPTILVGVAGWGSVQLVEDVSPIPRGLPDLTPPDPSLLSIELVLAAFALAVVIAVQGVGVSQTVENYDGTRISPSRDMLAQGAANAASGLLSGIPAGGSVGQTALNESIGARSRLSGIFAGIWMLVIVLLVPGLVGQVPMAVLAALMIQAGLSAIDTREARSIWNSGRSAQLSILVTFLASLVLSIPLAVGVGVGLAIVLFVVSAAADVRARALVRSSSDGFAETPPPDRLRDESVTVLDVYGSLFFAGARTLAGALPSPRGATRPVVVLRLRGRTEIGSTLVGVLADYADQLAEAGGRLYLSGVDRPMIERLRRVRKLDLNDSVQVMPAEDILGLSTRRAVKAAESWLAAQHAGDDQA